MSTPVNRRFDPSSLTSGFVAQINNIPGCIPDRRWISTDGGIRSVLFYTDGAAPSNGQEDVRAGCGIVLFPGNEMYFALERTPGHPITSNRAELRAAQASLNLRHWKGEGFQRVVVATDSEYVVRGISEWISGWQANRWRTANRTPVKNKDLWEKLLKNVEDYEEMGTQVQFWLIPREQNEAADACARKGANLPQDRTEWNDYDYLPPQVFNTLQTETPGNAPIARVSASRVQ